ncbi:hypothetical protein [Kitasatospora sp. LaBMicrA B282]|uniref:hypothetical protein n=1 Tax=Kitasatospora sp. LaBMicrA B282 TaxID=3420949 RepID=UPI003D0C4384
MSAVTTALPAADELTARLTSVGPTTPAPVPEEIRSALMRFAGCEVTGSRLGSSLAGAARGYLGLPLTPYTAEERAGINTVLATLLAILLPEVVRLVVDDQQVVADALAALR